MQQREVLDRHLGIINVSFTVHTPAKQIARSLILLLLCQQLDAEAGNLLTLDVINECNS